MYGVYSFEKYSIVIETCVGWFSDATLSLLSLFHGNLGREMCN